MKSRRRFFKVLAAAAVAAGAGGLLVTLTPAVLDRAARKDQQTQRLRDDQQKLLSPGDTLVPDVPRDVIPPLDFPLYVEASQADWLEEDDIVVGFSNNGDTRAYPIRIMNFHEIVNDVIGGDPILITYCPLIRCGLVFYPLIERTLLTFGNTGALYESDLVMYDRQTESYWWQISGRAVKGTTVGKGELMILPLLTTTWRTWRRLYPETKVLSLDTGFIRPYSTDYFANYNPDKGIPFPVSITDRRVRNGEIVVGVELVGRTKAYPLSKLGTAVTYDEISGTRLAIFSNQDGPTGAAFYPKIDGVELDFDVLGDQFMDRQTGSLWGIDGRAVNGKMAGRTLQRIADIQAFWFSWVTLHPSTDVY